MAENKSELLLWPRVMEGVVFTCRNYGCSTDGFGMGENTASQFGRGYGQGSVYGNHDGGGFGYGVDHNDDSHIDRIGDGCGPTRGDGFCYGDGQGGGE